MMRYILTLALLIAVTASGGLQAGGKQHKKRTHLRQPAAGKKPSGTLRPPAAEDSLKLFSYIDSCAAPEQFVADSLLLQNILFYLHVRYHRGGVTIRGIDCSGFVSQVYLHAAGMELPHSVAELVRMGVPLDPGELRLGDLVFFRRSPRSKRISHVGIYLGEDHFVHASRHNGVRIDSLGSRYFASRYVQARRPFYIAPGKSSD